jgi:hypothetical protein
LRPGLLGQGGCGLLLRAAVLDTDAESGSGQASGPAVAGDWAGGERGDGVEVERKGKGKGTDRKEKQNSRRAWPVCALSYIIRQSAANGTGKHCFRRSPPDRC